MSLQWPPVTVTVTSTQTVVADVPTIELELTLPGIQGPPGPAGADGEPGPEGPPGDPGATQEQTVVFASPVAVWQASHTIPITPSVYTYDTNGLLVEGDVSYPTPSTVRIEWAWPMAGRLVLTT